MDGGAKKVKSATNSASPKKRASSGCASAKKAKCDSKKDCMWVPGTGCRIEDNLPLAVVAKVRKMKEEKAKPKSAKAVEPKKRVSSGCTGAKKPKCDSKEDCIWVPNKGCRVEENVPLAVLAKIAAKAKAQKMAAKASAAVKAAKLTHKKSASPARKTMKKKSMKKRGGNDDREHDD